MTKRAKKTHNSRTMEGYAVVAYTEEMDQAREYKNLLEANDIPVSIREYEGQLESMEIAVVVPEEYLDEAHVIIESQQTYDDFYDYALDDESDHDFDDDDIFDEGF